MFTIPEAFGKSTRMFNHLLLSIKTYGERTPDVVYRLGNLMCINELFVAPQFVDKQNVILTPVISSDMESVYRAIMQSYPKTTKGLARLKNHSTDKTFPLVQPILVDSYDFPTLTNALEQYCTTNPTKYVVGVVIGEGVGKYYYQPEHLYEFISQSPIPLILGVPRELGDGGRVEQHPDLPVALITSLQSDKRTSVTIRPSVISKVPKHYLFNVEDESYFAEYFSKKILLPAAPVVESPLEKDTSPLTEMQSILRLLFGGVY